MLSSWSCLISPIASCWCAAFKRSGRSKLPTKSARKGAFIWTFSVMMVVLLIFRRQTQWWLLRKECWEGAVLTMAWEVGLGWLALTKKSPLDHFWSRGDFARYHPYSHWFWCQCLNGTNFDTRHGNGCARFSGVNRWKAGWKAVWSSSSLINWSPAFTVQARLWSALQVLFSAKQSVCLSWHYHNTANQTVKNNFCHVLFLVCFW